MKLKISIYFIFLNQNFEFFKIPRIFISFFSMDSNCLLKFTIILYLYPSSFVFPFQTPSRHRLDFHFSRLFILFAIFYLVSVLFSVIASDPIR